MFKCFWLEFAGYFAAEHSSNLTRIFLTCLHLHYINAYIIHMQQKFFIGMFSTPYRLITKISLLHVYYINGFNSCFHISEVNYYMRSLFSWSRFLSCCMCCCMRDPPLMVHGSLEISQEKGNKRLQQWIKFPIRLWTLIWMTLHACEENESLCDFLLFHTIFSLKAFSWKSDKFVGYKSY